MPMTTMHALVPVAAALAFAKRPVPWELVAASAFAAAAPDVDGLFKHFFHLSPNSIYAHRGAMHSLFVAVVAGIVAACCHRLLKVRALTAAVVVGGAAASHGILDMMTDSGQAVAYLWPLSSVRLFADCRWIHSLPVHRTHMLMQVIARLRMELWQLIIPMFIVAAAIRALLIVYERAARRSVQGS